MRMVKFQSTLCDRCMRPRAAASDIDDEDDDGGSISNQWSGDRCRRDIEMSLIAGDCRVKPNAMQCNAVQCNAMRSQSQDVEYTPAYQ